MFVNTIRTYRVTYTQRNVRKGRNSSMRVPLTQHGNYAMRQNLIHFADKRMLNRSYDKNTLKVYVMKWVVGSALFSLSLSVRSS